MPKKQASQDTIKTRVRSYLKKHGLAQFEFADVLEIAPSHLSEILNLKEAPSLRVAVAIEEHTGIPPRDFVRAA